jgi:hypothetical protein
MPYCLIPTVLGTSFILIWVFIVGMVFSDGHREALRQ